MLALRRFFAALLIMIPQNSVFAIGNSSCQGIHDHSATPHAAGSSAQGDPRLLGARFQEFQQQFLSDLPGSAVQAFFEAYQFLNPGAGSAHDLTGSREAADTSSTSNPSQSVITFEIAYQALLEKLEDSLAARVATPPRLRIIWNQMIQFIHSNESTRGTNENSNDKRSEIYVQQAQVEYIARQQQVRERAAVIQRGGHLIESLLLEDPEEQKLNVEALEYLKTSLSQSEFEELFKMIIAPIERRGRGSVIDRDYLYDFLKLDWAKWYYETSQTYPFSSDWVFKLEVDAFDWAGDDLTRYLQISRGLVSNPLLRVNVAGQFGFEVFIQKKIRFGGGGFPMTSSTWSYPNLNTFFREVSTDRMDWGDRQRLLFDSIDYYYEYVRNNGSDVPLSRFRPFTEFLDEGVDLAKVRVNGLSLANQFSRIFVFYSSSEQMILDSLTFLKDKGVRFQAFDVHGESTVASVPWDRLHLLEMMDFDFTRAHPATPSIYFYGYHLFYRIPKSAPFSLVQKSPLETLMEVAKRYLTTEDRSEVLNRLDSQGDNFLVAGLRELVAFGKNPNSLTVGSLANFEPYPFADVLYYFLRFKDLGLKLEPGSSALQSLCELSAQYIQLRSGSSGPSKLEVSRLKLLGCEF